MWCVWSSLVKGVVFLRLEINVSCHSSENSERVFVID